MPEEMNLATLARLWRDFIQEYYRKEVLDIANSFPEKRSLLVSYRDLEVFDSDLAAYLLDKPNSAIYAAEMAIRDSLPPDVKPEVRKGVHFRVKDLPPKPLGLTEVRELRAKHIGKLVAVSGLVRKATQVKPKLTDAVFQCARCLAVIREPQFDSIFKEPLECYRDQGGCGKSAASTRFILLTNDLTLFRKPVQPADAAPPSEGGEPQATADTASKDLRSVFIDTQKIEIQESPEGLRGGDQPERLTAYAEDDLCKKISPGDKVVLNGVLRSQQKSTGQVKSTFFDWYLEVNSIELEEHEFEEVEITPEEEEKILKLAHQKDIYRLIVGSIAPTIYGMEIEKEALALQMFGGVAKVMPDGTRIRGDIHALLVGDPGCLIADERVVLGNGAIIKLGSMGRSHLQKIDEQVLTGQGGRKRARATCFHIYRDQPVIELLTESGKCIKGTPNHPLLAVDGPSRSWKRLDAFKPGDRVATLWHIKCTLVSPLDTGWKHRPYRKGPHSRTRLPEKLDKDVAALLGYLLGDGWVRATRLGFDVNDDEQDLLPVLTGLVRKVFGLETKVRRIEPKDTMLGDRVIHRHHPIYMADVSSMDAVEALSFLKEKRVPDLILRSPDDVVAEFLAWLYEADGCAFSKGRGRRSVQLKSSEVELLRDVQMLLLRFGIASRVIGSNLTIRQARSIIRFSEHIGFRSEKKRRKLAGLVEDCKKLRAHLWNRQLSERVVSVRPAGFADVYDIEVPDGHRFIANGIVSHNTAKSQLLRYVTRLVPRGIYASGKASTAAGLTAAAVHDEFGEGRWTLEAGALVLADKGLAAVDELDKMSEQDSSSMHEAMEQQMISIAKAGITATLQSRCSILAAANPKEGRFDEHSYLVDQIDLAPTLLSRFDVIFPLTDKPDQKKDAALAGHIVNTHLAGEIAMYRRNVQDRKFSKEEEKRAMRKVEPEIMPDFLRKYIAYARSRVFPVMTKDVMEMLQEYYVNIRSQAKSSEGEGGGIPMTPRQIEALIRLSEASARVRLSPEVTAEDADRAKRIVEHFLRKVASEGGRFDIDAIMTGTTHVQRERIHTIIDIIEELDEGRGVTEEEVLRRTKSEGMAEDRVKRDLQRLYSDGRLFMPSSDRYKVAREHR